MAVGDLLRRIVDALDRAGIAHMVAGSFASGIHGAPRMTHDVDVVIDPDSTSLARFLDALDDGSYYVDRDVARTAFRQRGMFNVIDLATGWKVDLIIRKNRAFSAEELRRRVRADLDGAIVSIASPEDTIIAKLEWSKQGGGSERQRRDVASILAVQADALDRAYLKRWIAELGLDDEWAIVTGEDTV